ncbi:MAG: hypothetical protein Q9207_006707 [Kuettlingeria erythrocarpa]
MGGNYTYVGGETAGPVSKLFWLDLNETFPVDTFIAKSTLGSVEAPPNLTAQFGDQIGSLGGAFFYDNTTIYLFSGLGEDSTTVSNELATYDTEAEDWLSSTVAGGAFASGDRQNLLFASVPQFGTSFALGGNYPIVKGLLKYDSTVQDNLRWTNITQDAAGGSIPSNIGGVMVHVPMGKFGVLLIIGGADSSRKGTQYAGYDWDDIPMDEISVYDIDSNVFYDIQATGDVPPISRSNVCHGVSRSPDSSSFQVTIYGGWNLAEGASTEDVYVLTVPSFRWIKMTTDNVEAVNEETGRDSSTCATWNEAQMIVLGGRGRIGIEVVDCDPSFPPVRVLDLAKYEWQSEFDPNRNYSVHPNISAVIGGDSTGGATLKTPEGGWGDHSNELSKIFAQTVPPLVRATTPASPQTNNTDSTQPPATSLSSSNSSSRLSGGAIAGICIGALVGIGALASLLTFLFIRRRRRRSQTPKELSTASTSNGMEGNWGKAELADDARARFISEAPEDSRHEKAELGADDARINAELDVGRARQVWELSAGSDNPVVPEMDSNRRMRS